MAKLKKLESIQDFEDFYWDTDFRWKPHLEIDFYLSVNEHEPFSFFKALKVYIQEVIDKKISSRPENYIDPLLTEQARALQRLPYILKEAGKLATRIPPFTPQQLLEIVNKKIEEIPLKQKQVKKAANKSFEDILTNSSNLQFIDKMLLDFGIWDNEKDKKYIVPKRKRGKIFGVLQALRSKNLIQDLSDSVLMECFSSYIGTHNSRLKRDSKVFDKYRKEAISYINQHYGPS